ncbi:hypothetical protein TNCV_4289161 [Trichonephila clavipes]|nr:hypothetical protein TNCV_4289161 [Trichonephila clavipes]
MNLFPLVVGILVVRASDSRPEGLAPYHDEFHELRSGYVRQVTLETITTTPLHSRPKPCAHAMKRPCDTTLSHPMKTVNSSENQQKVCNELFA